MDFLKLHISMECFLFEIWEDLRVKMGEREIFQSSDCFTKEHIYGSVMKLNLLNKGVK